MVEVWGLPPTDLPPLWKRVGRGVGLLGLIGLGTGVSAGAGALTFGSGLLLAGLIGILVTTAVNVGLYLGGFRLLTPSDIPHPGPGPRRRARGDRVGNPAVGRELPGRPHPPAQHRGVRHVRGRARADGMAVPRLGAMVYAAELNVVLARHLWPVDFFRRRPAVLVGPRWSRERWPATTPGCRAGQGGGDGSHLQAARENGLMASAPLHHVHIHGHEVGYRRAGEGPVLLLVHGIAGSSRRGPR